MTTHTYDGFGDERRAAAAESLYARGVREATEQRAAHEKKIQQNRAANERQGRTAAAVAAHQEILDAYDPDQLRADVVDTHAAALESAEDGNLSAAITAHLVAIIREVREYARADTAIGNGATPRPELMRTAPPHQAARFPHGLLKGSEYYRDHTGSNIQSVMGDALTDHAQRLYFEAIAHAAQRAAEEG